MSADNPRSVLRLTQNPGESDEAAVARASIDSSLQAAVTIKGWARHISDELDLTAAAVALHGQAAKASANNLTDLEGMLATQAHVLNAVFHDCARRALANRTEYPEAFDRFMKIAFRAQGQCRSAIEALAEIKNPRPFVAVGQANVAHGPQQVNNGVSRPVRADARAGEKPNQSNELLEDRRDGQRLEPGAASFAGAEDSGMATVETFNGATHR